MTRRWMLLVFAFGLLAAACGGNAGESDQAAASPLTDDGSSTTTEEAAVGVHSTESDLGEILVGPDGMTLYVFVVDTAGTSTCYDACAELWPPVPAGVGISPELDGLSFGVAARDDDTGQLTVNGMPLYWYAPDESPGDTSGQAFNDVWFVVDSSGAMLESAAPGSDNPVIDYDY